MFRYIFCFILLFPFVLDAQKLYFPPLSGPEWQTTDPSSLRWCSESIDSLYQFLESEQSKAFIVLKDGKIVLEKYFDTFTKDSLWYWASAGKTLTAFLIGMAQQEGALKLTDKTSAYLGKGWTSCPQDKEDLITIWHQLTMSSGLDDGVADNHCTQSSCLVYKSDAGSRWAYHNAPYTLLRDVLTKATGLNEQSYIQTRLKSRTGMNGLWFTSGFDNVFASTARSMARFGLLVLNKGIWNGDSLLHDQSYFNAMVNPSQSLNESYGYLWWLNGKASFMLPGLQVRFTGSYAPEAPKDMFAGIGKNGQLLCVVPSQNLVVLRMGTSNGTGFDDVPIILCNQMWALLNRVICNNPVADEDIHHQSIRPRLITNPVSESLRVEGLCVSKRGSIWGPLGQKHWEGVVGGEVPIHFLPDGYYYLRIEGQSEAIPFVKHL